MLINLMFDPWKYLVGMLDKPPSQECKLDSYLSYQVTSFIVSGVA